MDTIFQIANDLVVIFFDLLIFTKMITLKQERRFERALMYGGCGLIIVAYFMATYVLEFPASTSSTLCMVLPSLLLFFYLSKYKDSRFLMTFCFVDTVSFILAFLGRWIGVSCGKNGSLVALLTTTALYLLILRLGRNHFRQYHQLLEVVDRGWRAMTFAAVLIYITLIFTAAYPKPLIERMEYCIPYLMLCAVVLSSYVVFIASIVKTRKIYEQNKQLLREQQIYHIAYTDALTGLDNRASYLEQIHSLMQRTPFDPPLCCVMLDINDFKAINDRYGHHRGDQALQGVAKVLKEVFAPYRAEIFRLGGDEFAAVLTGVKKEEIDGLICQLHQEVQKEGEHIALPLSLSAGWDFFSGSASHLASTDLDSSHLGDKHLADKHLASAFGEAVDCDTIEDAFVRADMHMYENKRKFYGGRQRKQST